MPTTNSVHMTITNHSFVIRLWVEEWIGEEGTPKWRGHIIHIPSMRDKYFDDFAVIISFIEANLGLDQPKAKGQS